MPTARKIIVNILIHAGYSPAMANRIAIDYEDGDPLAREAVRAAS